jgi:NAD-dependent DNA ligase
MELAEFQRLNAEREAEGEALYANPRNLAAGTVKLLDLAEARKRRLSVLCYGLGACEPATFATLSEFKARLTRWGFPTRDDIPVQRGIEAAWTAIQKLDGLRRDLPFPTDGAVVKVDRLAEQQKAGRTSKFPHWAVAFKFPPDRAETVLRAITMQVGRTGAITPVAELDPVLLAGSTVARATLHNADEIARKDIREGDTVRIQKAGEIIPQILEVVHSKRPAEAVPFDFEGRLKELGLDAVRVGDEAAYKLRAPSREMKIRRLAYLGSKFCLDIDGLGDAIAEQLVNLGIVNHPTDIFSLSDEEWLSLPEFGPKSLANIKAAISASTESELWRIVNCLGIPDVGVQTSKDLAAHFGSLEKLANCSMTDFCVKSSSGEKLFSVANIGENIAASITGFFQDPGSGLEVKALLKAGFSGEKGVDTESDFLRSLEEGDKAVYIRLKKSCSILETLKSFGVSGADDRLLIKIVAYNRDFKNTMSAGADELAAAIRAKSKETEIYQLLEALRSKPGELMISRSGAPMKADDEVFRFCHEQALFRYKKVLRLFDIGYDINTTPEAAEVKVRSFFRGEKWRSLALKLWEDAQSEDIYKISIESIQPGDAFKFEFKAKERLEEQRVLRETKATVKSFGKKEERTLDLIQQSQIEPDKLPLANRLIKSSNVIETIESFEIQWINAELILRLIASRGDVFANPPEDLSKFVENFSLTPKRLASVSLLFETLSTEETKALIAITKAPLSADSELFAYAVQKTNFYARKCLKLLQSPVEKLLTGHNPDKALKELLKQKPHYKFALELWQAAKRQNINDVDLDSAPEGEALQFEKEAIERLPKKASLSDIESLKQLSTGKSGNVIIISGKIDGLNREEAKLAAEKLGYKIAESVTSSINLLVIGEDPGPAKIKKALALKIPVVPFSELKPYAP